MKEFTELLSKASTLVNGLDTAKAAISASMFINLIEFLQETFEDFGEGELTEEQQAVLCEKYSTVLEGHKALMKQKIAEAEAAGA